MIELGVLVSCKRMPLILVPGSGSSFIMRLGLFSFVVVFVIAFGRALHRFLQLVVGLSSE